ncbi:MAG: hypothetical protein R2688_01010 [Fimbriimonadaceae bacterium]
MSGGDPINVANGEEEYVPDPDLTVYNPYGPDVSFLRQYRSGQQSWGIIY